MPDLLIIDDLPIRVTAEGRWLHGDKPLHPKVAILFAKCVVPNLNGDYALHVGQQTAPLLTSDTAYFVRTMDVKTDNAGKLSSLGLTLSDGKEELLNPATMMIGEDSVLYCRIQRHGLMVPCRFMPQHAYTVLSYVTEESDAPRLEMGGQTYEIASTYDARPLPVA